MIKTLLAKYLTKELVLKLLEFGAEVVVKSTKTKTDDKLLAIVKEVRKEA